MKFHKSLWKLFYKKEIIKVWKETKMESVKKNMDVMKKVTFCIFIGHKRQKLFWGTIIVIRRVLPSNFVIVTFLLTSLRKVYSLRRLLKHYWLLMEKIAVLILFCIRLQASSWISMQSMCIWWMGIFLAVLCRRSLLERHHWERQHHSESIHVCGRQWIDAMYRWHSNFNLL